MASPLLCDAASPHISYLLAPCEVYGLVALHAFAWMLVEIAPRGGTASRSSPSERGFAHSLGCSCRHAFKTRFGQLSVHYLTLLSTIREVSLRLMGLYLPVEKYQPRSKAKVSVTGFILAAAGSKSSAGQARRV